MPSAWLSGSRISKDHRFYSGLKTIKKTEPGSRYVPSRQVLQQRVDLSATSNVTSDHCPASRGTKGSTRVMGFGSDG